MSAIRIVLSMCAGSLFYHGIHDKNPWLFVLGITAFVFAIATIYME